MKKAIVLYDGNCTLCRRTVKTIGLIDIFRQLTFINVLSSEANTYYSIELNFKLDDLLFDMHIVEGTKILERVPGLSEDQPSHPYVMDFCTVPLFSTG